MSAPDSDKGHNPTHHKATTQTATFQMEIPSKVALVKPAENKTSTIQSNQTIRTISQQQPMRVMVPATGVQGTGGTQIFQTHVVPQSMIKQVEVAGRTQITTIPARSLSQTAITVTRPPGANAFISRVPTTIANLSAAPRITTTNSIRASTPSSSTVTNITTIRGTPSTVRTSPVQLFRASLGPQRATRMVQVPTISTGNCNAINPSGATITASLVSQAPRTSTPNPSPIRVVSSRSGHPQQAYVATLAAVLPPRQPTATLVYSSNVSNSQPLSGSHRLAVSNPRQVRPIQLASTGGSAAGIRTTTASISIRGPTIPVLASTGMLPSGTIQNRNTSNVSNSSTNTSLPSSAVQTRIIQVQPSHPSGQTQMIPGRIAANVMTLHPVVMNTSTTSASRTPTTMTGKVQPSLTFTQVGKLPPNATNSGNISIAAAGIPQGQNNNGVATATLSQSHQIAQIVGLNPTSNTPGAHQIQIITPQNASMVPLTLTRQPTTISSTTPNVSTPTGTSQIVRGINLGIGSMAVTVTGVQANNTPIAKVLPQQQQQQQQQIQLSSAGESQLLQTLVNSTPPRTATATSGSTAYYYGTIQAPVSVATTNIGNSVNQALHPTATTSTSVPYTPQPGSFVAVPISTKVTQPQNVVVPASAQIKSAPVCFNPTLIVDGSASQQQIVAIPAQQQASISNIQHQQQQSSKMMIIPMQGNVPNSSPARSSNNTTSKRRNATTVSSIVPAKVAKTYTPQALSTVNVSAMNEVHKQQEQAKQQGSNQPPRMLSPHGRASSDGSTTVSATSSPGADQQEEINMTMGIRRLPTQSFIKAPSETLKSTAGPSTSNGHDLIAPIPKRKMRKQANKTSSNQHKGSHKENDTIVPNTGSPAKANNKENAKPTDIIIKKPKTSLLENYKQSTKIVNNHFQRYSDVKPRDERRPTVMDLANQPNVMQKVHGWKMHHLCSQVDDLIETENAGYERFGNLLKVMEAQPADTDVERITELLKGCMQRSKCIAEGVNEARTQMMRLFEHKNHVAAIISRCASRRNFKRREK